MTLKPSNLQNPHSHSQRMSKRGFSLKPILSQFFHYSDSTPTFLPPYLKSNHHLLDGLLYPETKLNSPSPVTYDDFRFLRDDAQKGYKDADLICKGVRNLNEDEIVKYFRQFRGVLSESLVIQVLKGLGSNELRLYFFLWAGRQIGYTHTAAVYYALVDLLEDGGNDDRVPDEFSREIKNDDAEVLGKLLNVIVRRCFQNGLWNLVLEELGRLK